MKKWYMIFIICLCMVGINGYATDEDIRVQIDNQSITFDINPFLLDGQIWMPLRAVMEKIDGYVNWNEKEEQVELIYQTNDITLKPMEKKLLVNGEEEFMDYAPIMLQDRTFLPIDFLKDVIGIDISWNEAAKTVEIMLPQWNISCKNLYLAQNVYDEKDGKLLVRDCNRLLVFSGKDKVAERLNNSFYGNYIYGLEGMSEDYYTEYKNELTLESQEAYQKNPEQYQTKFQRRFFDIGYGKGDLFAVTLKIDEGSGIEYYYPKVFDIKTGEELVLSELLDMNIEEIESILLNELEKNGKFTDEEKLNFLKRYSFTIDHQTLKIFYPENLNPPDEELLSEEIKKETFFVIPCSQLKWKVDLNTGIWTEKFYEIVNDHVVYKDIPILQTENIKSRVMDFLLLDKKIFKPSDFDFEVKYTPKKDDFFEMEMNSRNYVTQMNVYAELPIDKQKVVEMINEGLTRKTKISSEVLHEYGFDEKKAEGYFKSILYSGNDFSTSYGVLYVVQENLGNKVKIYVETEIPDTVFR